MQPDIPLGRPVVLIVDDTPDNLAMLSSRIVSPLSVRTWLRHVGVIHITASM